MIPISYITNYDGSVTYIYDNDKLIQWHKRGKEYGDCGMILISRTGKILTYHLYGTIEHPRTTMSTLTMVHNELFDGKFPTDDERVNPKYENVLKDCKLVMLDMSKVNK